MVRSLSNAMHFSLTVQQLAIRISGLRISGALRLAYLRATFAQPVSTIDTISPGKVSTRITTSSNTIQLAISQQLAQFFQALGFTVGAYVVSFVKGWLLTFVASASLVFILVVYGIIVPPLIKKHKLTEAYREDGSALAYEIFSSIRIVVAFGAENKLATQHKEFITKAANNEKTLAPHMGMMMAPVMLAMYGTFGLVFWFGVLQYSRGQIDDVGNIIV